VNLVRVTQDDILSERRYGTGTEQERIQRLAQRKTNRPCPRLRQHDDQLIFQQRPQSRLSHHERGVLLPRRRSGCKQLLLCLADR
jgi:hypothetical protein